MNDGEREQIIRDAISFCTKKGIRLGIQSWGIERKKNAWSPKKDCTCCALACVLLTNQHKFNQDQIAGMRNWTIEQILGTNDSWVRSFQKGFDGYRKTEYDREDFAYELGVLIREEYIK